MLYNERPTYEYLANSFFHIDLFAISVLLLHKTTFIAMFLITVMWILFLYETYLVLLIKRPLVVLFYFVISVGVFFADRCSYHFTSVQSVYANWSCFVLKLNALLCLRLQKTHFTPFNNEIRPTMSELNKRQ